MKRLGLGVIGLGRRWWRQYEPALRSLRNAFEVRAVCDEVQHLAVEAARRLGCGAVAGPAEMMSGRRVDAVLLADSQWFGLWPIELACRHSLPVFCGAGLERDDAHADTIVRQVRDAGVPALASLAASVTPATRRLRELLDTDLGPARLLVCDIVRPAGPAAEEAFPVGTALLDWCGGLLGSPPATVLTVETAAAELTTLLVEWSDGRAAQISVRRVRGARPRLRAQVVAERGTVHVSLPRRLAWRCPEGWQRLTLRSPAAAPQLLLAEFHQAVCTGRAPVPDLDRAYQALTWLRAAHLSRKERSRVRLDGQ